MDRLLNYAFLLLIIYLFVLDAGTAERWRVLLALGAAFIFSLLAFIIDWLTLDGVVAASVFGIVALGFGGWGITGLVLLFFVSSTLLTANSIVVIEQARQAFAEKKRRDGPQVWANGFWVALCAICASFFNINIFLLGAAGAIATATADTWATELGSRRFGGNTYLITNFQRVKAGTDGGISLQGTLAALGGSLFIAIAAAFLFSSFPKLLVTTVTFGAGFSGCMVDSYLGAALQRDDKTVSLGSEESMLQIKLDNNFVNWAATGFGSLAAIIINLFFL